MTTCRADGTRLEGELENKLLNYLSDCVLGYIFF